MRKVSYCLLAWAFVSACAEKRPPLRRVDTYRLSGNTVQFIPAEGQLPYCLIFTTSSRSVVRQLTMTPENKSVPCEAGKPIGGVSYRILVDEGPIKAFIFFSDRKLNAASVAEQVVEMNSRRVFNTMDLRLPGQVSTEILEFSPEETASPTVGGVVGPGGTLKRSGAEPSADGGL